MTGFYSLRYSSTGLERAEDNILNGSDERLFGRRLADFFTGRDPRGGNVATTIDPQVQQAAWDAMEEGCNGPCKGAVVAMEPSTGKILAMVSSPSYDPNLLASHDVASSAGLAAAAGRPRLAAGQPRDLGDLPARVDVQGGHDCGGAAGRCHPETQLTAQSTIPLPDSTATLENYGGQPCGGGPTASLRDAFAKSCNTAFVQLGINTGTDALKSTAQAFGLDSHLAADPAAGRGIHRRTDPRQGCPRHLEHRAEGRGTDTTAERAGRRNHREQRGDDAAVPGRQPQGTRPGQYQHHRSAGRAAGQSPSRSRIHLRT